MRFCFLLFFPIFLHAGWTDWLFSSHSQTPQTFECPCHCGEWGSEAIQKVEWQGVLAIYELDKMGHACLETPFPYLHLPKNWDDPWCQRVLQYDIVLMTPIKGNAIKACRSVHSRLKISPPCACTERDIHASFIWEINNITRDHEKKGLEFYLFFDSCVDKVPTVYEEYDDLITFDSFQDLKTFSHSLDEDIEEYFTRHVKWQCSLDSSTCLAPPPVFLSAISKELSKMIEEYNREIRALNRRRPPSYEDDIERNQRGIKYLEKDIAEVDLEIERWLSEGRRYDRIFHTHMPLIRARLKSMFDAYTSIFDHCIAEHQAPAAYLNRSEIRYDSGDDIGCIEDIKKLFEITPNDLIAQEVAKKLEHMKGAAESEVGLFDEAILTLSSYISKHPNHKEAYIERAIALFETGDFHSAVEDFSSSGLKGSYIPSNWEDDLDFSRGLIKGITVEGLDSLINFLPAVGSSLYGLSHGLWAFATSPEQTSRAMCKACREAMQYIKNEGFDEAIHPIIPEFRTLMQEGEKLSYVEQGELIGKMISRVGIEFVLLKGTAKGVKIYRDLRKANAILSLERMAASIEAEQILINCHKQWWSKTAPIIEELKTSGGRVSDNLYKAFRGQNLSELQVRKILHQTGFKTFSRPKGIPESWSVQLSKNGGGMRYKYLIPDTTGDFILKGEVRVMPGNPNSKWPSQRKPYVKHSSNGQFLDKNRNIVPADSAASHIPINEYNFEKLNSLVSHE